MFIFKGFATYASLCVNTPGINNAIGELSSRSMTYTKEKGYYRKPSISPEIGLVSFITKRNDQLIELDVDTRDHILTS